MIRRISFNARRLNVCRRLGNLHPPNEAPGKYAKKNGNLILRPSFKNYNLLMTCLRNAAGKTFISMQKTWFERIRIYFQQGMLIV